ncbi:MAG: WcaF family extracellular polysaccharide biosynthesis acetyltransferase [Brumimicrobium sp.]|nr:WcaF family extracellular polysaccharide biosynthesis acetyltransferase [Brumimicrobium sp.]
MKKDLSSFNNDWYNPGNKAKRALWYFINLIFLKNAWNPSSSIKIYWLKVFGAKIGKGVVIKPKVNIKYPWKLIIGNHCWIGEEVWIDNLDTVTLEDNVCISQGALLQCGNHNYKKPSFDLMIAPITLKEGSWVGARCNVAPGVKIDSHAVLSMGSTATKDLEAYKIYAGNPAVFKKDRVIN